MNTLHQASHEWATRPDDQRFLSLADLKASVLKRKSESWTAAPLCKDLRVLPAGEQDLALEVYDPTKGERRQLHPTNWGFGQLAGYAGAPAGYLRKLPAELAAINLQFGLEMGEGRGKDTLVLAQSNGSDVMRSMTTTSYGRIWDHQLVQAIENINQSGRWTVPSASYAATNPKRATTLYASDRDVFIFLVDDKNPIDIAGRQLRRGFYSWNSEVGKCVWGTCTFLYDFICDNRTIWGATNVQELRVRHTSGAPERFAYEGERYLLRYANEGTQEIVAGITRAQNTDVPINKGNGDTVESWLQKRGFTKSQAKASVETADAEMGSSRSIWDIVNGVTAYARSVSHTDERVDLETKAGKIMADVTK